MLMTNRAAEKCVERLLEFLFVRDTISEGIREMRLQTFDVHNLFHFKRLLQNG